MQTEQFDFKLENVNHEDPTVHGALGITKERAIEMIAELNEKKHKDVVRDIEVAISVCKNNNELVFLLIQLGASVERFNHRRLQALAKEITAEINLGDE